MRLGVRAATAAAAAVGAGAVLVGAGRHASSRVLGATDDVLIGTEPLTVYAAVADRVTVTRTAGSARPGIYGLAGPGCHAVAGEVVATGPDFVTRRLERVHDGSFAPGSRVWLTPQVYAGDPGTALGLDFVDVDIPGELGPLPAWFLPGYRDTWVIAAHGLGATREQALPVLPLLSGYEFPVLDLAYRGDPGAPPVPDRVSHFGDAGWRDLDAAMRFAVAYGAHRIVLYGWSAGATMAIHAAARSPVRAHVSGLVLDSPIIDWPATLRRRAARIGLPKVLFPLAVRATEGRAGLPRGGLARSVDPAEVAVPTLVVHGPDDSVTPWEASRTLAARRPDLVLLYTVPQAEHAAMWNADITGYHEILRRFLTPLM